ncbi:hypothetical protein [Psychromicrobium sp. YIM B11713]|uniref:hypothetical protein n=1 Tax=Psychromicrobium sp. YIM B11713 TaxID=3145233 RepID=UPI00374FC7A9
MSETTTEYILENFGHLLTNAGGNEPAELLRRLNTDDNLVTTNLPVFTMAVAVQAQVHLLKELIETGRLSSEP